MELKRFEVDGGTLAVEVAGSGPLVICAAGMGDTRDSYSEVANQLVAKGYCVASMDTRGHGDSSAKFNRYGDEATADDFLMIVEKLNLGPAVLAGCSFAAAAAVIAAGRRPEAVAGIVLLGPFLRNGMGGVIGLWILPLFFLRPYGPWMWQTYAATLWPGLGDKAKERAKSSRTSLTRPDRWSAFQAVVSSLDHRQAAPWIDQVQAPVLVLMGDKDPDWSNPLKEAEWVASNFKESKIVAVPGAGHGPQMENPRVVAESILEQLTRLRVEGAFQRRPQ